MTVSGHRLLILIALCLTPSFSDAAVRYVKPTASGTGDCGSWANACALPTGLSGAAGGDELWVKSGTYAPFELKNGVKVIGGFAGTESLASASDPDASLTVVDGGGNTQCVTGADNGNSTVLRGFTLRNCKADEGGAVFLNNNSALFVHCTFHNNTASEFGGAVSMRGTSSPHFVSCIFHTNGDADGQLPYGGGAIFVHRGSPTFTNCLFYNNKAGEGGVLMTMFGTPTLYNCTLTGNSSGIGYGGAIHDQDGRVTLKNTIVWNNTTTRGVGYADQIFSGSLGTTWAVNCDIQGGWVGINNSNADPLFQTVGGDNYYIQQGSPCKNAGDNSPPFPLDVGDLDWDSNTDETIPWDLAHLPRVRLGAIDMGAYEIFSDTPPGGGE